MGTKDSLRKIIADFQQIIKDKGYFFENELTALDEKLDEDVFRLAVVGEYSTGKSTFINALIGQDLLLHMKREATATITYIHNVPKNSDKIGKCEIYYHTGEKKELDNLHDLAKYTTTKSDVDVVREIAHVDVYVNFMGTDVPIIITDTPGLNGMAEGHKEITIGEIKKAHACIYLFSIKGITAYDVTFIKELALYQQHFIFLQNFIDELKISEGESAEGKISEIDDFIQNQIINKGFCIDYEICGISGLKALAGRDTNIKKLYESDVTDLTDEQRRQCYEDSRFEVFLKVLNDIIVSGDYKQVIYNSIIRELNYYMASIEKIIQDRCNEKGELLKEDTRNELIEKLEETLQTFDKENEIYSEKISNFIRSKNKENKKLLEKEAENQMNNLCNDINKLIDQEIVDFEAYEKLRSATNGKIGEYFSDIMNSRIINNLMPDMKFNAEVCLQLLYEDALRRSEEYSGTSWANKSLELVAVSLEEGTPNVEVSEDLEDQRKRLENERTKIFAMDEKIAQLDQTRETVLEKAKNLEGQQKMIEREHRRRIQQIGERPEYQSWKESYEYSTSRDGFFGRAIDKFFGKKTEQGTRRVDNSSEINEWNRRYRECIKKLTQEEEEWQGKMEELRMAKNSLEQQMNLAAKERKIRQNRIQEKEKILKQSEENFELVKQAAQKEFCGYQKKALKMSFHEKCLESEDCVLKQIQKDISKYCDDNRKVISRKVVRIFNSEARKRKTQLEELKDNNVEQLQNEYEKINSELKAIMTLRKEFDGIIA